MSDQPRRDKARSTAAQAASQQSTHLVKQLKRRLDGKALQPFLYRDFGSLVSLSEYSTIGNLMGFLTGRGFMIEGYFARVMYRSLYRMHQMALFGAWREILETIASALTRRTQPRVKLH